jgi:cysteine desulfurase family protein
MIYLDNAATSWPKPENVYQTLDRFLREKGGNAGHGSHSLALAAQQTIDETRLLTAHFIGAPEVERIIFTLNCTDSLNLAMKGILKSGDHVITSSLEHNAVMRPLAKLATQGIKTTRIPVSPDSWVTSITEIEKAITSETRMLIMIHASNVTGVIQPINQYGALARKYHLLFLVDAAQSAGHLPIDVVKDNIDLLAFSAHKGPFGPPGLGILYISPRADPDTLREGGTGTSSESDVHPQTWPSKYEAGTLNSLGIAGLGSGLKFINSNGLSQIQQHNEGLLSLLKTGLIAIPGITLYLPGAPYQQTSVISFNLGGYDPGEVGVVLDQAFDIKVRTGLHCAPQVHRALGTFPKGTVRLSPGFFNTEKDIQETLEAIRKIAVAKRK